MKQVLILGASGSVAEEVIDLVTLKEGIKLTLFVRNARRLRKKPAENQRIVEGDALDYEAVKKAIDGQDLVYVNLAGDLEAMAKNIVRAMQETGVRRIIAISSIGIYATPVPGMLKPYRRLADLIEASDLDYTILRPTWFTSTNEVDYELTQKGESEKGSVISRKSLATFISNLIDHPHQHVRANLGINKPNS